MENWKFALSSVWSHKMRSFLTMLGIIIGVAAVVVIMSLGNGITGLINKSGTKAQEYTNIYFSPTKSGNLDSFDVVTAEEALTDQAYVEPPKVQESWVKQLTEIKGISGYYLSNGTNAEMSYGSKTSKNVNLMGVSNSYFESKKLDILAGRSIQASDYTTFARLTMIDENLSKRLFTSPEEALNKVVEFSGLSYRIIGVYSDKDAISGFGSGGTAIMTNTQLASEFGLGEADNVVIHITDTLNAQEIGIQAAKRLTEISGVQQGEFKVADVKKQLEQALGIFGVVTTVLAAIAGISLFVGGIGVMNIMLVSVTERTREIGLRKALGATRGKILMQFLIESTVLTVIGGLIGMAFAMLINTILGAVFKSSGGEFAELQMIITLSSGLISIAFSAAVGIIFGLLPANKASKLDPIEALRYE